MPELRWHQGDLTVTPRVGRDNTEQTLDDRVSGTQRVRLPVPLFLQQLRNLVYPYLLASTPITTVVQVAAK